MAWRSVKSHGQLYLYLYLYLLRFTPASDLHVAFKMLYEYDFVTKLCRCREELIQSDDNANARNIGHVANYHKKILEVKFCGGQS
jgi:hypothetical protein